MIPSMFRCAGREDFIGPARKEADRIERLIKMAMESGKAPIKLLILGPPGTGKSELTDHFCRHVGASKWSTHKFNGVSLRIEDCEELARTVQLSELYGAYRIVRVEEIDRMPAVAQVRLLTLLDDLPPGNAFICSSNCTIKELESRFQSRFQVILLQPPSPEEIGGFLSSRWSIAAATAKYIATLACGNVRQALLDAQSHLAA